MAFPPPWSALPDDVLKTLAAYLLPNFFDVLAFGGVCRSWRAAVAALRSRQETIPRLPRGPALPCLTFRAEPAGGIEGGGSEEAAASVTTATTPVRRCFHSLANDRIYCGEVPEESRDWACWCCSHGWLLMLDSRGGAFLFDPITGARVGLPALTALPCLVRIGKKKRDGAPLYIILSPAERADPTAGGAAKDTYRRFTLDDLRCRRFVKKLVLSSSPLEPGCIAMLIYEGYQALVYARPGEESWSEVENTWDLFKDVIYHEKEGRFYALSAGAGIFAIDFATDGRLLQPTVKLVAPTNPYRSFENPKREYLVALPSGMIIQVCKYITRVFPLGDDDDEEEEEEEGEEEEEEQQQQVVVEEEEEEEEEEDLSDRDYDEGGYYELGNEDHEYSSEPESHFFLDLFQPYRTVNFKVFLLLLNASGEGKGKKHWVQLRSIGNCSLFLGYNQSMSIPASGEAMGKYRPNCIYFTDDIYEGYRWKPYGGHDCGIFELGKQTLEFFFPPDAPQMMPPPLWIFTW